MGDAKTIDPVSLPRLLAATFPTTASPQTIFQTLSQRFIDLLPNWGNPPRRPPFANRLSPSTDHTGEISWSALTAGGVARCFAGT